jgi:hypothetical protein
VTKIVVDGFEVIDIHDQQRALAALFLLVHYQRRNINFREVGPVVTLLEWTGHSADEMLNKRFSDFLNMAGRIYFETHIAPLLRMQGFFNEFAIDMITADGKPLQMIANANEGRNAAGKALFMRLMLIKATDRRRYERNLLEASEVAKTDLASERESSDCGSSLSQFLATICATRWLQSVPERACWGEGRKPIKSIRS